MTSSISMMSTPSCPQTSEGSHTCKFRLFGCVDCCHEHVFTIGVMYTGSIFLKKKVRNMVYFLIFLIFMLVFQVLSGFC